jgi:DnaJ-class molecular chaperone
LKRRYHRLSQFYHPDRGGTKEQMGNLTHAYESALIYVKANNGMEL